MPVNVPYYEGIIHNADAILLFSKVCQNNSHMHTGEPKSGFSQAAIGRADGPCQLTSYM